MKGLTTTLCSFHRKLLETIDQSEFEGFEYVNPLLMSSEECVWKQKRDQKQMQCHFQEHRDQRSANQT